MFEKPTATISRLKFSGGDEFQLLPNEKVILVGPNNSGKSQSLREILAFCGHGRSRRPIVIADLDISKKGDEKSLRSFLESNAELIGNSYQYRDWQVPESHVQFWNNEFLQHGLLSGFIRNIAADTRLTICNQQESVSPGQQKTMPQHVLYDDDVLMKRISGLFRRAFGKDLMFDFRGGRKIPIHVGDLPYFTGPVDRVGDSYVQAVRTNPLLDQQGDGMRSYAGILFQTIVADLDITLIDEPEAFLHPPQMRRLGETLAAEVRGQLIVATHSSDILRGFLEGTKGNVRILRIRREGNGNLVAEAAPEVIRDLWEKPDLRYSNALEGIFHEQTVICEDDSDCRLINSVADYLAAESGEQWQDTAYVPTGGKHGIPRVASVLRQVGVPVKAVFDIDFLSEQMLVQATVEAFGGEWEDFRDLWLRVDAAVRKGNKPKSIPQIKSEIIAMLSSAKPEDLPKGDVIEAMKQSKAWSEVKRFGTRAIPNGDAQRDFESLREKLTQIGVFLIPVGEIENFCPAIGSHGPKFVTKLLSTIPLGDNRLSELHAFVREVHKGQHNK